MRSDAPFLLGARAPSPASHSLTCNFSYIDKSSLCGLNAREGTATIIFASPVSLMGLAQSKHKAELREAGWHSRGYLPHFDGREVPQFISLHLFDSLPVSVVKKWKRELDLSDSGADRILLQRRIEKYLDQGYGQAFMKDYRIATMIQDVLLSADGKNYRLSAWVIMPNHIHILATRFANFTLASIVQSLKSITSHKANRILKRRGQFWMPDYFDRYIRNADHFIRTIRYIENNPVKARLCMRAKDWPCSSAGFRKSKKLKSKSRPLM